MGKWKVTLNLPPGINTTKVDEDISQEITTAGYIKNQEESDSVVASLRMVLQFIRDERAYDADWDNETAGVLIHAQDGFFRYTRNCRKDYEYHCDEKFY